MALREKHFDWSATRTIAENEKIWRLKIANRFFNDAVPVWATACIAGVALSVAIGVFGLPAAAFTVALSTAYFGIYIGLLLMLGASTTKLWALTIHRNTRRTPEEYVALVSK